MNRENRKDHSNKSWKAKGTNGQEVNQPLKAELRTMAGSLENQSNLLWKSWKARTIYFWVLDEREGKEREKWVAWDSQILSPNHQITGLLSFGESTVFLDWKEGGG